MVRSCGLKENKWQAEPAILTSNGWTVLLIVIWWPFPCLPQDRAGRYPGLVSVDYQAASIAGEDNVLVIT